MIGRTVSLNGWPFTITGVLPKAFRFWLPQQFAAGDEVRDIDAYIPIPDALMAMPPAGASRWEEATRRFGPAPFWIVVVGRLRADVAFERARAEMQAIYSRIAQQDPNPLRESRILHFATLGDKLAGGARRSLVILLVAVGFVLLIACANVANLLLSRASTRRKEIAIRTAVGAGRMRVIRQFLTESALLALLGCAAGLILGYGAISVMLRLSSQTLPRLTETAIDGRVLAFALGISLLAGVLFGLAPAIAAWKAEVFEVLKVETGASSPASGASRLRALLAASELALAIVLLSGAGLMLKSFWRMHARPPGFAPESILVMRIALSGPHYSTWPPKQAYTEELLRALQALPGVEAAGIDAGSLNTTVRLDGSTLTTPSDGIFASIRGVSPGYLRAMGIPLRNGTWPARGSLFEVLVNETFARQVAGSVTGRHLGGFILNDAITGVVADFKTRQLDAEPLAEIYMPYERLPLSRSMRVVVRTAGRAAAFAPAVRELLGTFAATALLLACIGTYGVMAYSVSLRTREIGIRLALGARRGEILGMVVRQGMTLASCGIAAGTAAGLALTRLMASLLYDVEPNDPWVFSAVALSLAIVALLAAIGPAMKAAHVDPLTALRYE